MGSSLCAGSRNTYIFQDLAGYAKLWIIYWSVSKYSFSQPLRSVHL